MLRISSKRLQSLKGQGLAVRAAGCLGRSYLAPPGRLDLAPPGAGSALLGGLKWPAFAVSGVVGPAAVGDRGVGVESQAGFVGGGGQGLGDVAPGVPVGAGAGHEFGQEALGLVDEASGRGELPSTAASHIAHIRRSVLRP